MANLTFCKANQKADPNYPFRSYRSEAGEIIYSVPLEAPEDQTLSEPMETEEEWTCTEIRFPGGKPMRVHFVEIADRKAAYEQCAWLNTLHTREHRYSERYQLLRTPEDAMPGGCIWDYFPKMRRNDDGYTLADYSDLPDRIEEAIREQLPTSELYVLVYRLHLNGIKPKQIGECLGIPQEMVYFYRKEALRIAQDYRKQFFDEGPYVFPHPGHKQTKRKNM